MDAHSLQVLEYPKVVERLAAHTTNGIGRDFARELQPLPYPETVVRRLQETREARLLRDSDSGLPLGGIRDIRPTAERARVETRLTPRELLEVHNTVSAARRLRTFLVNRAEKVPLLAEMAGNIPVLQLVEARIEACISEAADVKDSATPELARLRSAVKVTSHRLNDKLQAVLGSAHYRPMIQEGVVTIREGRYCIPVRAEYARAFGGIVHDSSSSGATVFIEPAQTLELGNELKQLQIKAEQEVERILRDLSALVGSYYGELQSMISILGHMDVIHAKAVLAEEMSGEEPRLNRRGIVRLRQARHPLLLGNLENVVPIDVELGERFTTLLITGPNTGGKTVTLKTLGLLTLMTMAGMQIPCGPDSEVAIFDQVFADIGDEQDIQQSLSTFSAHLKNLVRILSDLGPNALVVMDEVGAGTDPAEGAALAKSLLDYLMARNVRVAATTHYGELKEYAYARPGVENASVEFSKETLSPTYRVLLGVPGMSNAFYIAQRLGLPAAIVDDARQFLSHREIETGELLQQIEASRRQASEAERQAVKARQEAQALRDEYEERVRQIADVQRTVRQQAQEEARLVLRRASDKAEGIIQDLQRLQKGVRKGPSARQKLGALRGETYEALQGQEEVLEDLPPVAPGHVYRRGDRVRVVPLGMDGQLLEDPKGNVAPVQIGAMRATLPLDQLRPLQTAEAKEQEKREARAAGGSGASQIALRKATAIAPELMLRAMRVEEAQPMLDKYVDDAFAAGLGQARIIHGKGTGALRKAVHEFLSGHPAVASYKLAEEGEGGDGATVVIFQK